ncbi:MAG: asparagine--tRNA ligase [Ignavibacteria bacterium GWB2_35_12]|nr:MAG: asparagine--tRNA ligase [Ignavibacteria bacterium GWB2_35_12]OGU96277.1 MAG: asparagine--tRNA ligase [Ignavibacteria bacterium RIFOXYA2_FULL_35_10]OGV20698.1 MAG: asparagine--tRNA ligase [Ignavibacteria bacterium RIFOXYC2_FULL_35_21]
MSRYKSYLTIEDLHKVVGEEITLRGWVFNTTGKGKLQFILLRDGTGVVQCVVFKGNVNEETFEAGKSLTQESSVIITGKVKAEERAPGGFEIDVTGLQAVQIAKDYPITPKEHGDAFLIEHRHLWLRSSRQNAIMRVRAAVIKAIRDFFDGNGFKLMDSPLLTPNACEGTSTLFETEYFDLGKAYLSQSGQLYAEASALALGKVYTFGPTFRAERSKTRKHLTEFWMVEPEMAYFDLDDDMDLAEDLVEYIVQFCLKTCTKELAILERDTTFLEKIKRPFYRISYSEAVDYLHKNNIPLKKKVDGQEVDILPFPWGEDFGTVQEEAIMEQFDKPCIIHRYPTEAKAFYMKRDPENSKVVLAMDMIGPEKAGELIGGSQREDDYDALMKRIKENDLPVEAFQWYLDLRKYGSVPHSGFGLGVERTVKWITGASHIREVIPFPRMIYRIVP